MSNTVTTTLSPYAPPRPSAPLASASTPPVDVPADGVHLSAATASDEAPRGSLLRAVTAALTVAVAASVAAPTLAQVAAASPSLATTTPGGTASASPRGEGAPSSTRVRTRGAAGSGDSASTLAPTPGAAGLGDPYFPWMGNGGYDTRHYDIDLKVDVERNQIDATTRIDAVATQDLSALNLDLRGLKVDGVKVDGQQARFSRKGVELSVVPPQALARGQQFTVEVKYHGSPQPASSQGGTATTGWKHYDRGIDVDSQPEGASTWFPANDHPRDKATYTFHVDVPEKYTVAANGVLEGVERHDGRARFTYEARDEMAPYLATVQIGRYVIQSEKTASGLTIRNYFPPAVADKACYDFGRTAEMIDYFSRLFGPYPFETYGVVVVDHDAMVKPALEAQTLSLFDRSEVTGDRANEGTVAHELAHHWWGNSVSVKSWRDIWLNEGFAQYAEWLWMEKNEGSAAVDREARETYDNLSSHRIEIGRPGANNLFDDQVYERGALTLHALRKTVGDDAFFAGLQRYYAAYRGGNAEIADFRAVMEEVSGKPLGPFFDAWLYQKTLPPLPR